MGGLTGAVRKVPALGRRWLVGPALPRPRAAAGGDRRGLRARRRLEATEARRLGPGARGTRGDARWRRHLLRRRDARNRRLPLHTRARRPALHGGESLEPARLADRGLLADARPE